MTLLYEQRSSDSPYIETVTQGQTTADGGSIRPAECQWHMVFVRERGNFHPYVVGPLTKSGTATWQADAEILWIKFTPGVFMPHIPFPHLLDRELLLPNATGDAFWLKSATWETPSYENAEVFIERLIREEVLVRDPVVAAVLQDEPHDLAPRTVRHRFRQATGLTQKHIQQAERALRAAALLRLGVSILDTVHDLGYSDQPHLTRSLRQFVGHTPGQFFRVHRSE